MKRSTTEANAKTRTAKPRTPRKPRAENARATPGNFDALEQPRCCRRCGGTDLRIRLSQAVPGGAPSLDRDCGIAGVWRLRRRTCNGCGHVEITHTPADDAAQVWAFHNRPVHFAGAPEARARIVSLIAAGAARGEVRDV